MFGWGYEELRCCSVLCGMWGWSAAPPRSSTALHRGEVFFELWVLRVGAIPAGLELGGAARSLEQGRQGSEVCVRLGLVVSLL